MKPTNHDLYHETELKPGSSAGGKVYGGVSGGNIHSGGQASFNSQSWSGQPVPGQNSEFPMQHSGFIPSGTVFPSLHHGTSMQPHSDEELQNSTSHSLSGFPAFGIHATQRIQDNAKSVDLEDSKGSYIHAVQNHAPGLLANESISWPTGLDEHTSQHNNLPNTHSIPYNQHAEESDGYNTRTTDRGMHTIPEHYTAFQPTDMLDENTHTLQNKQYIYNMSINSNINNHNHSNNNNNNTITHNNHNNTMNHALHNIQTMNQHHNMNTTNEKTGPNLLQFHVNDHSTMFTPTTTFPTSLPITNQSLSAALLNLTDNNMKNKLCNTNFPLPSEQLPIPPPGPQQHSGLQQVQENTVFFPSFFPMEAIQPVLNEMPLCLEDSDVEEDVNYRCAKPRSKKRKFTCNICGKHLSQRGGQHIHMRIHSQEKPYTCKQCGTSFTQACNQKRHERSHTGEKPFSCNICSKAFNRKQSMMNHMKKQHPGQK